MTLSFPLLAAAPAACAAIAAGRTQALAQALEGAGLPPERFGDAVRTLEQSFLAELPPRRDWKAVGNTMAARVDSPVWTRLSEGGGSPLTMDAVKRASSTWLDRPGEPGKVTVYREGEIVGRYDPDSLSLVFMLNGGLPADEVLAVYAPTHEERVLFSDPWEAELVGISVASRLMGSGLAVQTSRRHLQERSLWLRTNLPGIYSGTYVANGLVVAVEDLGKAEYPDQRLQNLVYIQETLRQLPLRNGYLLLHLDRLLAGDGRHFLSLPEKEQAAESEWVRGIFSRYYGAVAGFPATVATLWKDFESAGK